MGAGKVIHMALLCMMALIVAVAALNDPFVKTADAADDALLPRQLRRASEGLRTLLGAGLLWPDLRRAVSTTLNGPPKFCWLSLINLFNPWGCAHPFIGQLCNPHHAPPLPSAIPV